MHSHITTAAIAARLEAAARALAPLLVATYTAGLCTGLWLHRLNDQLAALWLAALGLAHLQQQPAAPGHGAMVPAAPAAAGHAAMLPMAAPAGGAAATATAAADLTGLPVVELRRLARERLGSAARLKGRRSAKARRAALIEALTG